MNTATPTVLVAGASGYIGRHVVAEFVARGRHVIALLRQPPDSTLAPYLAGAKTLIADVGDPEILSRQVFALNRIDTVVSCLAARGGRPSAAWAIDYAANRHLLMAAENHGTTHFSLLSAVCLQTPVLAFQRAKLAFEETLKQSTIDWSIVRPTAFFKSLAGQLERVRAGRAFLLFGTGDGPPCLPISEADTARYMADTVADSTRSRQVLPVGGPGPVITPRERGEALFALADRPPRFKRIPIGLVRTIERVAQRAGAVSERARNAAEFARIARFYATEPMLVIDPTSGRHSERATPRYGQDTLSAYYQRLWRDGLGGQRLEEQALFKTSTHKR